MNSSDLDITDDDRIKILNRMVYKDTGYGKKMGNDLYFHYSTITCDISVNGYDFVKRAQIAKENTLPYFTPTVIKINYKTKTMSFIHAPLFDEENEPEIKTVITVKENGDVKVTNGGGRIYHHKWMFVKENYPWFDVEESKKRSLQWFKRFSYNSSKIGNKKYWTDFLQSNGLEI